MHDGALVSLLGGLPDELRVSIQEKGDRFERFISFSATLPREVSGPFWQFKYWIHHTASPPFYAVCKNGKPTGVFIFGTVHTWPLDILPSYITDAMRLIATKGVTVISETGSDCYEEDPESNKESKNLFNKIVADSKIQNLDDHIAAEIEREKKFILQTLLMTTLNILKESGRN